MLIDHLIFFHIYHYMILVYIYARSLPVQSENHTQQCMEGLIWYHKTWNLDLSKGRQYFRCVGILASGEELAST